MSTPTIKADESNLNSITKLSYLLTPNELRSTMHFVGNYLEPSSNTSVYEIFFKCQSCGAPTDNYGKCPYCGTINKKRIKEN